ncbi:UDP-galactose transporter [Apophysomyces sp. BC1034]|nr:UDP-galactose transporter [Apophysomyces sp. BC1015]KAG0166204.1 UDP-galactose transporter [Apophysomyces sp. BC1021]KAG0183652.1 UDP-galactose transporter [Apophysomyces sp. BC1034]
MLRFALCVAGIYACFLTWGVVQERVSTTPYGDGQTPKKFRYFVVLNLIQSLIAAIVALIYMKISGKSLNLALTPRSLYLKYAQVAFFNCIGSPFGYAALKHIDYPTMILGKSCKLMPVMFMNVLVYRRRFPLHNYVCVGLITAGVSMFMLYHQTEPKKSAAASNSMWGLFLLCTNLAIDGLTNATQDQIFHAFSEYVSGQHMMFFMNAIGSLFSATYLVLHPYNDELWKALEFFHEHPAVIRDVLLFGVCGAVGQCFIFYTLQHYGSLRLVTVTVTRKLFTMLLSVFWFKHELSIGQWVGVALVFSAIGIEAYIKKQQTARLKRAFENPKKEHNGLCMKAGLAAVVNPIKKKA